MTPVPFTNTAVMGFIPHFLDRDDPRPAQEQLDANYQHGGGFYSVASYFKLEKEDQSEAYKLVYEEEACDVGDDPIVETYHELSRGTLRSELIVFFEGELIAIIQPDGSFDAARFN